MVSQKKRRKANQSRAIDFRKKKDGVGKNKKRQENQTDTRFRAKKLVMPDQLTSYASATLTGDMDGGAYTSKGLVLREVMAHVKHYNAKMRKDGLEGVRELAVKFPAAVKSDLRAVMAGIMDAILDADASVRKAFKATLSVIASFGGPVEPYIPQTILYVSSGLSHIDDDVRLDTVRILTLLLNAFPRQMLPAAPGLLDALLHMVSNSALSGGDKAFVLIALESLVRLTFKPLSTTASTPASSTTAAMATTTTHVLASSEDVHARMGWVVASHSGADAQDSASGRGAAEPLRLRVRGSLGTRVAAQLSNNATSMDAGSVLTRVAPLMLSTWLECDPGSRLNLTRATSMMSIVSIVSLLANGVLAGSCQCPPGELPAMNALCDATWSHYVAHFPFKTDSAARASSKAAATAADLARVAANLNVGLCSLAALFVPSTAAAGAAATPEPGNKAPGLALKTMTKFLAAGLTTPDTASLAVLRALPAYLNLGLALKGGMCAAAVGPLLDGLVAFMGSPLFTSDPTAAHLAIDVVEHVGSLRVACKPRKSSRVSNVMASALSRWATAMFKALWVMRGAAPSVSERILRLLGRWALYDPASSEVGAAFAASAKFVAPLLAIKVGDTVAGGPFVALAPSGQALCLHLFARIATFDQAMVDACAYVFQAADVPLDILDTLLEVMTMAVTESGSLSPQEFMSFVVSALLKPDDAFAVADLHGPRSGKSRKRRRSASSTARLTDAVARVELLIRWASRVDTFFAWSGSVHITVLAALDEHAGPSSNPGFIVSLAKVLAATAAAAASAPTPLDASVSALGAAAAHALYRHAFDTSSPLSSVLSAPVLSRILDAIGELVNATDASIFGDADRKLFAQARSFIARGGAAYRA